MFVCTPLMGYRHRHRHPLAAVRDQWERAALDMWVTIELEAYKKSSDWLGGLLCLWLGFIPIILYVTGLMVCLVA